MARRSGGGGGGGPVGGGLGGAVRAGVSHDSPRAQTCTFEGPSIQKNTTKIQREDPQRGTKRANMVARGKEGSGRGGSRGGGPAEGGSHGGWSGRTGFWGTNKQTKPPHTDLREMASATKFVITPPKPRFKIFKMFFLFFQFFKSLKSKILEFFHKNSFFKKKNNIFEIQN